MTAPKSKATLLSEAHVLEQMGLEWTLAHTGACFNRSSAYIARSSCPKHRRTMEGGVKGKTQVVVIPAEARQWWATTHNADARQVA